MKVLSLFSGIGGLDLGFEWAGFETVCFCEIEEFPRKVLHKHWPNVPIIEDVRNVTKESVPGRIDCIIGGFPCQDISYAGKGAGIDYDLSEQEGTRSGLWWEYWRTIRELRPRYVVAENVSALTNRGLDIVLGSLAQIGYDAEWQIVSAASVGAPHIRERIFIVAYPNGLRCERCEQDSAGVGDQKGVQGVDWSEGEWPLNGSCGADGTSPDTRIREVLAYPQSVRHGGGSGEERGSSQRELQTAEQGRSSVGSEVEGRGGVRGEKDEQPDWFCRTKQDSPGPSVSRYPTPVAGDWKGQKRGDGTPATMLGGVVTEMWNTPNAPGVADGGTNSRRASKARGTHPDCYDGWRLSTIFVAWLMGFPIEWAHLKDMEMP